MSLIGRPVNAPAPTSASDTSPRSSHMGDWMAARRAEATKVGADGTEGDDRTAVGQHVQQSFATPEFLEAGKSGKDWFNIPPEFRQKFLKYAADAGEDGAAILAALDRVMTRLNGFLARSDVDEAMKLSMLSSLLSKGDAEYDDGPADAGEGGYGNNHGRLGTILSEVMTGNGRKLFREDDLEANSAEAAAADMEHALTTWMKENDVAVKPDTSAEYYAGLRANAETNKERRAHMTPAEVVADIAATRRRVREEARERALHPDGVTEEAPRDDHRSHIA